MLRLVDDQARWGEFPELEAFLERHDIPFDRFHEGKYDIDPGLRQFRPGVGCQDFHATTTGEVVVPIQGLLPIRDDIASICQLLAVGEQPQAIKKLQSVLGALGECLIEPAPLPDLEFPEVARI